MKCIYSAQRNLILAGFSLLIVLDAVYDDVDRDDHWRKLVQNIGGLVIHSTLVALGVQSISIFRGHVPRRVPHSLRLW